MQILMSFSVIDSAMFSSNEIYYPLELRHLFPPEVRMANRAYLPQMKTGSLLLCLSERRLPMDLNDLQGTRLENEADRFLCPPIQVWKTFRIYLLREF